MILMRSSGTRCGRIVEAILEQWDAIDACDQYRTGTRHTPSMGQLEDVVSLVLRGSGIDPDQRADAVNGAVCVDVSKAVSREEPEDKRSRMAVQLRDVGVRNRVERVAVLRLEGLECGGLTVQVYRHLVGVAAVVFHDQPDRFGGRAFTVHFVAHEAEQVAGAGGNEELLAWVVGWKESVVEAAVGEHQQGAVQRAAVGLRQFVLGGGRRGLRGPRAAALEEVADEGARKGDDDAGEDGLHGRNADTRDAIRQGGAS